VRPLTRLPFSAALLFAPACGGSSATDTSDDESTSGAETTGETGTETTETDGGDGDGDGDGDGASTHCADLGLPVKDFEATGGNDWYDVAGDFTVNTTFGVVTLSEIWTGCDNYIIIRDRSDSTSGQLFVSATADLWRNSARNTHYFFVNDNPMTVERAEQWMGQIGASIGSLDTQEETDYWATRVHFVTDAPASIEGSLGAFLAAHPSEHGIAIDRAQTWDFMGSSSVVMGGGFTPFLPVWGYNSRYYNFKYAQQRELDAQTDWMEVAPLDNETFPATSQGGDGPFSNENNNLVWPATFPDAATMATFDTMEMIVTAECGPDAFDDCGWWDYEAFVNLCSDIDCTTTLGEMGRWITPYHRPGERKWVIDATPMLGLLRDGGEHFFRFSMVWNMNPNTYDIRFRLRDQGGPRPTETVLVHRINSGFNDTYNAGFMPFDFTPPASATKVTLSSIVSGHGQDTGNCAEWCNHVHDFTVNGGATHTLDYAGQAGLSNGCSERVDEGVVPGQYGNWTPGRAGWCPGQEVEPWTVDITGDVTLGQANTLEYRGTYNGSEPSAHGRIRMTTYITYYE
jgi:hypothetical protein